MKICLIILFPIRGTLLFTENAQRQTFSVSKMKIGWLQAGILAHTL